MQKAMMLKASVASAVALAISLGAVTSAHADVQPGLKDAVAVGSDTVQYVADFGADGDTTGDVGYNFTNTSRRS